MKHHIVSGLLLILVAVSAGQVRNAAADPGDNLTSLVKAAIDNNPELKSTQARWQMYTSKVKQVSSLDDPMLTFRLQNMLAREPFVFNKDLQTARVVGISQQLPFWGKRGIRREVAQYEADAYKWSIEERKLELKRMVKEAWYQLFSVDKSLDIIAKNLEILEDFKTIAETKYSVGQGTQQDIFKAGLEKSKLLDMQISLQQRRKSLEANLNYLLYRPLETSVARVNDLVLPNISRTADQLKQTAFEQRPQIKNLQMLTEKGRASHRLAKKEFYPDFNLALEYMFREASMNDPGYNMFSLGVTFNLPIQRERRQSMLAESSSETTMNMEELNALRNSIAFAVNDALAQLDRRRRQVELYRTGLIPQAEQSLESAVISYRVNKVDFLTLLDGRLNLFNYERELYESQSEYMIKLAQLEAVVGVELIEGQRQ